MIFPHHFRKNLWVYSPSELLLFALFILLLLLGLGAFFSERPGSDTALLQTALCCLAWAGWLFFVALRKPPPFGKWGLVQGLAPWAGLGLCYGLMKPLVPLLHPTFYDAALKGLDYRMLGQGPSLAQSFLLDRPALTDFLSFCYLGLFAWLLGLLVFHSWVRRALYQRFMLGLILVYTGGFLGYLLYPAVGPRFAYPEEWAWLKGGAIFQAMEFTVSRLGSRFDVFPSLHGALSAYLLFWQWSHDRRGVLWGFPLTLGIWASTLCLGFHYLPDLVSGGLLAALAAMLSRRLEVLAGAFRRSLHPPRVWLLSLTEGHGDVYGKLAGRLSDLVPLGGETSPGFLCGGSSRGKGEEAVRRALQDLGEGPYWLRPSDLSGSKKSTLQALRPLSTEQVVRTVFTPSKGRFFIVQKALKATAVGICRSFPPQGVELTDVEFQATSLPQGDVLTLRLAPRRTLLKGWLDTPWNYFPPDFPLRGFQLFDLAQLARKLARRWGRLTEVEWILSGGKVYVLDGRPVRAHGGSPY